MPIFSDLDLAEAPDSPFDAPIGTWPGVLTAIETFDGKKDPNAKYLKFEFTESDGNGTFDHICQLPDSYAATEAQNRTRRSRIKQVLNSLNVAPEDMDTLDEQILVGTPVIVTTAKSVGKNGNTYVNLRSLKIDDPSENGVREPSVAVPGADPWDFNNL
jgi:hypothetical protein